MICYMVPYVFYWLLFIYLQLKNCEQFFISYLHVFFAHLPNDTIDFNESVMFLRLATSLTRVENQHSFLHSNA